MNEFTPTADPASTPTPLRVRAAMAEITDPDSLHAWDTYLDRVYTKSLETGTLEPLRRFLEGTQASIETYHDVCTHGLPPADTRVTSEQFIAAWNTKHPGRAVSE